MTRENVSERWTIRSTLVAVTDLDRSVAFYGEIGPFDEIFREAAVAVLGEVWPASISLILREAKGIHRARHGRESLGPRSIHFNVGSLGELDRIESVLRRRGHFSARGEIAKGASELLFGRDPDNLPLVFVCYAENQPLEPDYYRQVAEQVYSLDV